MEFPIEIKIDLNLNTKSTITKLNFADLVLEEHTISIKSYAKVDYKDDLGVVFSDGIYHINKDVMLSKHLVGVEMQNYYFTDAESYNNSTPYHIRITFSFISGLQMQVEINDAEKAKSAFKIIMNYYNYINGL